MGNIHSSDAIGERILTRRRSFQLKIKKKEIRPSRAEKCIQCGLLVPPTAQDLARQSVQYSAKMIQVGTRPCVRNRSTLTERDFEPSSPSYLQKTNGNPTLCYYGSHSDDRYHRIYSPYVHFQDSYATSGMGYPGVPETYAFATNQPMYFDLPKVRQAPSKWIYPAPQRNDFPICQQNPRLENGDVIWQAPVCMQSFDSPSYKYQQHLQTTGDIKIRPFYCALQKAKSWEGQLNQKNYENVGIKKPFQSMETIRTSKQHRSFPYLNPTPSSPPLPQSYSAKNYAILNSNRSNNSYSDNLSASNEYIPYCLGYQSLPMAPYNYQTFYDQEPTPLAPRFSMAADFREKPIDEIFRFSEANSGMEVHDRDRRRMIQINSLGHNGHNSWMNPVSVVRKAASKNVESLIDAPLEKEAKSTPKMRNAIFGRPSKFRFYLKESPRVTKMLMDTADRRIRSICDRFQCDLEVYSKVPKSGFLQYAIDITAPDTTALYACSRNLDSALGWFLTAQLAAARLLKY
ncbi:hypothetical protein Aperf_G00000063342 [Anoplocephala perfoliata]